MKLKGENPLLAGYSGKFGNQFVFKQFNGKTIITELSFVSPEPTPARLAARTLFGEAVAFAKVIMKDPSLAETYRIRLKPGQDLYHAAISAYMQSNGKISKEV